MPDSSQRRSPDPKEDFLSNEAQEQVATDLPLALGHLTLLDVPPPQLVRLAMEVGFVGVGMRLQAVHPAEDPWPMLHNSSMLNDTRRALDETGCEVWDVGEIRVEPGFDIEASNALFEAGGFLGAKFINVYPMEPNPRAFAEALQRVTEQAARYDITVTIEPMIYNGIPNLQRALEVLDLVDAPNIGLIIDSLHLHRFGGVPADLADVDPASIVMLQLCDAPIEAPVHFDTPGPLPRNQSREAPPIALEARGFRLLPGDGELPLVELVAQLPFTPTTVEAPDYPLQQRLTPTEIAERAFTATQRIRAEAFASRGMRAT